MHEISGQNFSRLVRKMAKMLNWKTLPLKHTGRISCITTLTDLGVNEEKIDIHLNWKSNYMRKYYTKDFIHTNENGPAATLARAIKNNLLEKHQQHAINPYEQRPEKYMMFG